MVVLVVDVQDCLKSFFRRKDVLACGKAQLDVRDAEVIPVTDTLTQTNQIHVLLNALAFRRITDLNTSRKQFVQRGPERKPSTSKEDNARRAQEDHLRPIFNTCLVFERFQDILGLDFFGSFFSASSVSL